MLPVLTPRLRIEELTPDDDAFMLTLLNDPGYISNIADRGIRTQAQARKYLETGPLASYAEHGYGMYAVRLHGSDDIAGLCGLVRRPQLQDTDIGYAFLPAFRGQGLAWEAAQAVWRYATEELALTRLAGIVSPHNAASIRLLEKLGLRYQHEVRLNPDEDPIRLYLWQAGQG